MIKFETVIGLEIYIQLKTKSKLFSSAKAGLARKPNTNIAKIDLALPGTLPVPNEAAVRMAIQFGLAIKAKINLQSEFVRKNYFDPRLPKGYQITQREHPLIGEGGYIKINLPSHHKTKKIYIMRACLEEETGQLLQEKGKGMIDLDFNRAGIAILKVTSAPELSSAAEAILYLKTLRCLVMSFGICSGNLSKGAFRCDINISHRPQGNKKLAAHTKIKNVNSFRMIESAIQYEIDRQTQTLKKHEPLIRETRLFDAKKNETRAMRHKASMNDCRYFPDPDLLPLVLTPKFIEEIKKTLLESQEARFKKNHLSKSCLS